MDIPRNETDLVDVGTYERFNHHKQLHEQLISLRDKSDSISSEICLSLGKTLITNVTSDDIKTSKLVKRELGDHILSLISLCDLVCHDTNLDNISNIDHGNAKTSENKLLDISACVEKTLGGFLSIQNEKFKELNSQVAQLQ